MRSRVRAHDGDLSRRPGVDEVGARALGVHQQIGGAESFAYDDADARHGCVEERLHQRSGRGNQIARLMGNADCKSLSVRKGDQRDAEAVAKRDEALRLAGHGRIHPAFRIADDTDRNAAHQGKAGDHAGRIGAANRQECALVDDQTDDLIHAAAIVQVRRDLVQPRFRAVGIICGIGREREAFAAVRQICQKRLDLIQQRAFIRRNERD